MFALLTLSVEGVHNSLAMTNPLSFLNDDLDNACMFPDDFFLPLTS
jgi:hypothetical protein